MLFSAGLGYLAVRVTIHGTHWLILTRDTFRFRAGKHELSATWPEISKVDLHISTSPWYMRSEYDQPRLSVLVRAAGGYNLEFFTIYDSYTKSLTDIAAVIEAWREHTLHHPGASAPQRFEAARAAGEREYRGYVFFAAFVLVFPLILLVWMMLSWRH